MEQIQTKCNVNIPIECNWLRRLTTAHLLRYPLSRLLRVAALVNDVTDLLAVHDEVNAICGQCQE